LGCPEELLLDVDLLLKQKQVIPAHTAVPTTDTTMTAIPNADSMKEEEGVTVMGSGPPGVHGMMAEPWILGLVA